MDCYSSSFFPLKDEIVVARDLENCVENHPSLEEVSLTLECNPAFVKGIAKGACKLPHLKKLRLGLRFLSKYYYVGTCAKCIEPICSVPTVVFMYIHIHRCRLS